MGLGKTISCVSLVAATLHRAKEFGQQPLERGTPPRIASGSSSAVPASHFAGRVWGMPEVKAETPVFGGSIKDGKKKAALERKADEENARTSLVKARSRATLIVCPLSTVSNWEDQFREHWGGEVTVVGGGAGHCPAPAPAASTSASTTAGGLSTASLQKAINEVGMSQPNSTAPSSVASSPKSQGYKRDGTPMRIYIYHGNARRPDPHFLADFDVVLTTYSTLASEYSKQTRSAALADEDETNSDGGLSSSMDVDGDKKKPVKKRKPRIVPGMDGTSPLQMVHWFRVVLDEAQCVFFCPRAPVRLF